MMTAMIFIELTGSTVRDGGEGSDCRDCLSSNALCKGVIVQKKMRRRWWLRFDGDGGGEREQAEMGDLKAMTSILEFYIGFIAVNGTAIQENRGNVGNCSENGEKKKEVVGKEIVVRLD
ncbi:hypothetical protein L1887_17890 [Cichorium endivia]|nr:hypothetical protein L1887_17890 [Cichorium endivia]